MSKLVVCGGGPLKGSIRISGAKNSALPVLAACMLSGGQCVLHDVPPLSDVENMCALLDSFGCRVTREGTDVTVDARRLSSGVAPYELVSRFRASFLVMGPLLARLGVSRISLPGGCAIGARPVDLHLKGFAALGARINQGHGYIEARAKKLKGAKIYLDFPSVGATQNLMMAACLADGHTTIENAATEPEVADLAAFLTDMGANILGAGTDTIRIFGVSALHGAEHTIIPDRIEAGTFLTAAAITHGQVRLENTCREHLKPVVAKLTEIGAQMTEGDRFTEIDARGRFRASDIKTLPFPGFPTDMQAQFMSLMSVVDGTSIITETVFENRFLHVPELVRMNANIKIDGRTAVIEGQSRLTGAQVRATDLRAGAALSIAALAARGETEIADAQHIWRGYHDFAGKLSTLGAKIEVIEQHL